VSDGLSDLTISRQPMFSTTAWRKNGCYTLGAQDIVDLPLERGLTGCTDEWNDLDHFDVTAETRRVWKRINQVRSHYPVLSDGFSLTESGEWTVVETPSTRGVVMKKGLWSVVRDWLPSSEPETTGVWILYSNKVSEKPILYIR
jgi:alpha-1,3-glucan synthase